jgi:hypothetical protein
MVVFLALTTFAGGIGLLTGLNAPPLETLQGSPFPDYTIPGLALCLVVGGASLVAAVLMSSHHPLGPLAYVLTVLVIIAFEAVEIWVIGSPAGVARALQVFYLSLGSFIIALAVGLLPTAVGAAENRLASQITQR